MGRWRGLFWWIGKAFGLDNDSDELNRGYWNGDRGIAAR